MTYFDVNKRSILDTQHVTIVEIGSNTTECLRSSRAASMSTLYLTLPYFRKDAEPYVLGRADTKATANALPAAGDLQPSVTSTIQENDHSFVYRARLVELEKDVVLKICFDGRDVYDLTKEAKAYTELLAKDSLKGVVPEFYGFFTGEDEGLEVACIIMEDCGDALDTNFDGVDNDGAMKILGLLAKLHKEGCEPQDFAERNVVRRDGQYRLIDFHDVKEHVCDFDGDWHPGDLEPERGEFGCNELRFWGKEFRIWAEYETPVIRIAGHEFVDFGGYPPQEVVDALLPQHVEWYCRMSRNAKSLAYWVADAKKNGIVDISEMNKI